MHLQNTGNEPVSKVRIQGVLPEGLSLEEGDTLTKEEETLAPGSETALQYTVKAAKTQDNGGSQDSGDREESNQNGGDKNPSPNPDQNDNGGNPSKGGDKTTTLLPRMQMPLTPGTPQIRSFSLSYAWQQQA